MRSQDGQRQRRASAPNERFERLSGSLNRAFPLPESGAFDDLLEALNKPAQRFR